MKALKIPKAINNRNGKQQKAAGLDKSSNQDTNLVLTVQ